MNITDIDFDDKSMYASKFNKNRVSEEVVNLLKKGQRNPVKVIRKGNKFVLCGNRYVAYAAKELGWLGIHVIIL